MVFFASLKNPTAHCDIPFKISLPKFYQFKILCEDNFSPILKFFGALNLNFQPKLEKSKNGASGVSFQNFFEKKILVRF